MQAGGRRIKADISGDNPLDQRLIQRLIIGAIGKKAALHHHAHEV